MSSRLESIEDNRRDKLARLKERGVDPYPHSYPRSHSTQEAVAELEGNGSGEVSVAGRITAYRSMGKISFADLRDGEGKIQILFQHKRLDEDAAALLKEMDIGDFVGVSGKLIRTRSGEPTVEAANLNLLAKSIKPLPEKWHGLADVDTRYRQRYLDLIANAETKEIFQTRSRIIAGIRQYLNQREFIEVETPVLQPAAGGALAQPFTTYHHALDRDLYLRIALELHLKRLIVGGFDRVYELGRTFRNEGLSTKHNPEFTMLECYQAYADYKDVMATLEEMTAEVCREVMGTTKVSFGEHTIDFKTPWRRLDLRQGVIDESGIDYAAYPDAESLRAEMKKKDPGIDPHKDRGRLIDDLISTYVEPKLIQPTILMDYPREMSPLAKTKPDDDGTVERFEAFAGGMEIANAFSELNDPQEQKERFEEQMKGRKGAEAEHWSIDEDYLAALEYGMPPTGGLGVGIDRLVMLLTGQQSIRQVILFPQLKEKD